MAFLNEILPEIERSIQSSDYLQGLPEEPFGQAASLKGAIEKATGGAVLVEFKRISPGSAGPRLPARTVPEFVRALAGIALSGLSCLACGPRFESSPADVFELTRSTALPVLFKDFVIHPIQIEAARRAGASAILLIARLETEGRSRTPMSELSRLARNAGLEVVLEFHDASELSMAQSVPADVYGINVRNLDSLLLEPEVAGETFRASKKLRPLLGLSGVESPADSRRFWDLGADGILVGTAFARAKNPKSFIESLRPPQEARSR